MFPLFCVVGLRGQNEEPDTLSKAEILFEKAEALKDENKMDKCQKYLKYTIYHLNKDEILLRLINLAEYKSL